MARKKEPSKPAPAAPTPGSTAADSVPIVAIGASAGGLEAFTQFLKALPADTGMAFVLVQHLAPAHPSSLAEILSRATRMPVMEVQDGQPVQQNHVYVIPPATQLAVSRGHLVLGPRETAGQQRVIDHFFRSLAGDQGHRAIGIVLSGTATDGTLGLEEIKAAGGITFAQDETAQHDSMPRSAVAAGCVDFVLPPQQIAAEIARIGRHPYLALSPGTNPGDAARDPDRSGVLQVLLEVTGVDLTHYKATTLDRRIHRRMVLHKLRDFTAYTRFLRGNSVEVEALYQDILINVTSFFRNPETFAALESSVFPKLLAGRRRDEPLRIWVPGCSTGQEAYSLAMALAEFTAASGNAVPTQVFATDLNPVSIAKARAGLYSKDIAQDVAPARMQRFFVEAGGNYRVSKEIRDQCVFAQHNVFSDPPFSRIDLISCRNLLIYLDPVLQHSIMPVFHYALRPGGFLLLGGSETVGAARDLFEVLDAKHKIFARKPGASRAAPGRAGAKRKVMPQIPGTAPVPERVTAEDLTKAADRLLLARYAPPGVFVNADLEIVQFRGDTAAYLTPAPGKASLNLLKMARPGLIVPIRAAVHRATKEAGPVREAGVRVRSIGGTREVGVVVIPLKDSGAPEDGGFLVMFEDPHRDRPADPPPAPGAAAVGPAAMDPGAAEQRLADVTQELIATREYLQSIIERFEATNDELQAANEEAQSANEELQSVNEELETSKEEIQAGSEELATVNDELNDRNIDLNQLNNDLVNLLDSVQVAIVMVDRDLRIRSFTTMAGTTLNLAAADVGRPIGAILLNVAIPNLTALLTEVIGQGGSVEREIQDRDGRWFSLRLRPYRTPDHHIDGAVMMLVDVDALERARAYAEGIVATVRVPLLVLDTDLRVRTANQAFYRTFDVLPPATENQRLYDLGNGQWDIPKLHGLMDTVLSEKGVVEAFEVEHVFEQIGTKIMLLSARHIAPSSDAGPLILLAIEDITARKHGERERNDLLRQAQAAMAEAEAANRAKDYFLATLSHELRTPLTTLLLQAQWLRRIKAADPEIRAATEVIEKAATTQAQLIDDLLDVSRIASGKLRLHLEPLDLGAILQAACETVRAMAEKKSIQLELELDPSIGTRMGDPVRLQQVVWNLAANAIKFTPPEGRVLVRLRSASGEPQIEVSDTGIGIESEFLSRIFGSFEQVDAASTRAQGGLGLGLTIVRSLVELHGGTVTAASPGRDQGATFTVVLPLARVGSHHPAGVQRGAARPGSRPDAGPVDFHRLRILVVEDDAETRQALVAMLEGCHAVVRGTASANEAMRVFAEFRPEVLVSDIAMPGEDGYSLMRRIRALGPERGGQIPALALTALAGQEDRERATAAGFQMHLAKPFDFDRLADVLLAITRPVRKPRRGD